MDENTILSAITALKGDILPLVQKQDAQIEATGKVATATAVELKAYGEKLDKLEAALDSEKQRSTDLEAKANRLQTGPPAVLSMGRQVIESDSFKAFRAGQGGRARVELKALSEDTASAGLLLMPHRLSTLITVPERARMRDLISGGTTTSNAVEFAKETLFTNLAAPVAEGALKPESTLTYEIKQEAVRTIAHFIRVTKQALDDVAALRSQIDTRLVDGLGRVEDFEIIQGDGTGQHLHGLLSQATAYSRTVVGDTRLDTLRRAKTQIRLVELDAEGIALHPADWEDIELQKGTDDRYLWTSVNDGGVQRVWRLPVVDSTAIPEGTFLMGAFRSASQLFDRQTATVELFEQDADNVTKNLVTIRAEERIVMVVYRPQAFIKGTFPA